MILKDVHFISKKMDWAATAPLLYAGITKYSPLKKWKIGEGHKVAVVGLGGLGHMAKPFIWIPLTLVLDTLLN